MQTACWPPKGVLLCVHTVDNNVTLTFRSVSVSFVRNESTVLRYVVQLRSTEQLKTIQTKWTLVVVVCSQDGA